MKMLETMERFNALLEKGGVGLTFEDCCKELGVLPPVLNEYLIKETNTDEYEEPSNKLSRIDDFGC